MSIAVAGSNRKTARTNKIIATKALACKLAKAAWHLMSQGSDYDPQRMCPEVRTKDEKLKFVRTAASQKIGVGEKPEGLIGGDGSPQFNSRRA
jgi:hypothetical protein